MLPTGYIFSENHKDNTAKNQVLRSQVDELNSLIHRNDTEATHRLGATEYELEQLREKYLSLVVQLETTSTQHAEEKYNLQDEVNQLKDQIEYQKNLTGQHLERLQHLESYLTALPTKEEHCQTLTQLHLTEQRFRDAEKRSERTQTQLEQYETRLGTMSAKLKRSEEREQVLQTQLNGAIQRLRHSANEPTSQWESVTPDFVEDLKAEVDRYRSGFEQAKKLLEAETHRAEACVAQQRVDRRQFDEQRARDEATSAGLSASISQQKAELRRLGERISELNSEKQDLLTRLLQSHAALGATTAAWRTVNGEKRARLLRELQDTVNEAVRLATLLDRLACGEKLDLATLLFQPPAPASESCFMGDPSTRTEVWSDSHGRTTTPINDKRLILPELDTTLPQGLSDIDLTRLLQSVHEANNSLSALRHKLADRYAEHLGGKLDCSIQ